MLYLEARTRKGVVRWPIRGERLVVGRSRHCDVVVEDPSISRHHLEIRVTDDGRVLVRDLGSRNGTWFGEQRIEEAEASLEQWFAAGGVLLTLREGLTLSSRDPAPGRPAVGSRKPPTEDARAAASSRAGETAPGREIDLERLAELLEKLARGEEEPEGPRHLLLAQVAEPLGARTAAVLQQVGDRWAVVAAWGAELPDEVESILAGNAAAPAAGGEMPGGPLFWKPLAGPGGTRGALVLHPWNRPAEPVPPALLVVAATAASWLIPPAPADPPDPASAADEPVTEPFVAVSPASCALLDELDHLAGTRLPLLLHGESGTGKELLARRIHARSERRRGPFVAINCAALPRDLLEAELFGIERAVATGVASRKGKIVLASGGTLFLDEIGDLPLHLQPKLLRALENGHVLPLGAAAPVAVDVRLVSASHQDLRELVDRGRFREDLLYRLAGAVLHVPPLRERPEDILPLVRFFAREAARDSRKGFLGVDRNCARYLLGYPWPGNVRELRHVVFRAVALADGEILHPGLLPPEVLGGGDPARGESLLQLSGSWREARDHFERTWFQALLARADGNLSRAAHLAGLSRSSLYRKLRELGLR